MSSCSKLASRKTTCLGKVVLSRVVLVFSPFLYVGFFLVPSEFHSLNIPAGTLLLQGGSGFMPVGGSTGLCIGDRAMDGTLRKEFTSYCDEQGRQHTKQR